jgi:hypothetical protein
MFYVTFNGEQLLLCKRHYAEIGGYSGVALPFRITRPVHADVRKPL